MAIFVKSRAQVAAETREAMRLGLLSFGEGDVPVATAAQERVIAEAGRRAVEQKLIAEQKTKGGEKTGAQN